jgi:phage antirepressor YoqD-like protein
MGIKIEQIAKLYKLLGYGHITILHKEGYEINEPTDDCTYKFYTIDVGLLLTITPENYDNIKYINIVLYELYNNRFEMVQDLAIDVDYNILKLPMDKYINELLKYV